MEFVIVSYFITFLCAIEYSGESLSKSFLTYVYFRLWWPTSNKCKQTNRSPIIHSCWTAKNKMSKDYLPVWSDRMFVHDRFHSQNEISKQSINSGLLKVGNHRNYRVSFWSKLNGVCPNYSSKGTLLLWRKWLSYNYTLCSTSLSKIFIVKSWRLRMITQHLCISAVLDHDLSFQS